jgi:hypothetical protein
VICTVKPAARPRGRSALGLRPHRHASRGRAPITPRRLRVLLPEVPAPERQCPWGSALAS